MQYYQVRKVLNCGTMTDYDEDEHIWPDYLDGIPADQCAQHIIDWTKEVNDE